VSSVCSLTFAAEVVAKETTLVPGTYHSLYSTNGIPVLAAYLCSYWSCLPQVVSHVRIELVVGVCL
jgi:hypothetical protein